MIALQPSEFYKALPVFESIKHSRAIVFAVLEGHSPGRIFVDQASTPTCAFLYATGAFYYAAGDASNDSWIQSLPGLIFDVFLPRSPEPEMVLFSFSAAWHEKLANVLRHTGTITIQRKMFHFSPEKYRAHKDWRGEIPAGYSLRLIDQSLAARYPAYQPLLDPATGRFGCALLDGESLASECSAVFVGDGEAEIDVYTAEGYRHRGFAWLVARAFIDECLSRGLRPNWSCWPEREASWKLALRLGFEEMPDVPALLWAQEL